MRILKDCNNIYLLPTIRIKYDRYYEWDLIYVNLEIQWFNYFISIPLKKEDI